MSCPGSFLFTQTSSSSFVEPAPVRRPKDFLSLRLPISYMICWPTQPAHPSMLFNLMFLRHQGGRCLSWCRTLLIRGLYGEVMPRPPRESCRRRQMRVEDEVEQRQDHPLSPMASNDYANIFGDPDAPLLYLIASLCLPPLLLLPCPCWLLLPHRVQVQGPLQTRRNRRFSLF